MTPWIGLSLFYQNKIKKREGRLSRPLLEARPMKRLKPLMVYDGDCGFCRRWIGRWKKVTQDAVDYEPYQKESARFPEIPEAEFEKSVYLFEPDGRVTHGAEA